MTRVERGKDADRGPHRRAEVGGGVAHADGRTLRLTGDAHEASERLGDGVVARLRHVRPGLSESRDRRVDQTGVAYTQFVVAESQAPRGSGPKVLDDNLRDIDQAHRDLATAR